MEIQSYDLDLDVDFHRALLDGLVTIHLLKGERKLVLDAVDLDVREVRVNGEAVQFDYDRKGGTLTVQNVPLGRSSVAIAYSKSVSDEVIFGLYKSKFGDDYMLVTDLEPAEARTVFPCKDHPEAKAVFNLVVTTQKGLRVISNSPVAKESAEGSKARFVFEPTQRMSTYLLFFGVGRFEEIATHKSGKEVLVATRPGESRHARFILDLAGSALKYYEDYFRVEYPLKKLHVIGLPEYHTGAMENWGAITSREAYVLVGDRSSVSDRQGAAMVISHEIAHQWFGDLVTMKWWDDLWLNESFATFMECKCLEELRPDWDPWTTFLRSQTFRSKAIDALSTTHPIEVVVRSPAEAGQVFDAISYGKGASILRMIESYVGSETFRKGVSSYLKRHGYSNATGEDLWNSIQRASGKPVSTVMERWIRMAGYPLVRVGYSRGNLVFTQSRFQLGRKAEGGTWPIPLSYELNGRRSTVLFKGSRMEVKAERPSTIRVNIDNAGYYSVAYAPQLERTVRDGFDKLSPYEKGGLMSDMYLLLVAGKLKPETYFEFVSLCSKERHPLVVETVVDHLSLLHMIANESDRLREHIEDFAVAQFGRLGQNPVRGEGPDESVAREAVTLLLAWLDTPYTMELAERFDHYDTVSPDVKEAVAVAYARANGKRAFETLLGVVKSTKNEVERGRIYSALTSFKDPELVERTLELGIGGEVSRSDSGYTITRASVNPLARQTVWEWIQKRHRRLWTIYGGSQQLLLYYEGVIPRCAVGRVKEVERFFSEREMRASALTNRRIIEAVKIRTRLRNRLLLT